MLSLVCELDDTSPVCQYRQGGHRNVSSAPCVHEAVSYDAVRNRTTDYYTRVPDDVNMAEGQPV